MYYPPFEVIILGTSSAIPSFNRFPSSQFVHINGSYLLIDCGEGTQMQLRKYKLPFARIDAILISHLHGDHIFGLPGLMTSLSLLQRKKELVIIAPPPLKEILDIIFTQSQAKITYPIRFVFTQNQYTELIYEHEKYKIFSIPLKHRIPTTGFVIQEQERDRNIIKEKIKEYKIPIHQYNRIKKGLDAEDEYGNIVKNELITTPPPSLRKYTYLSDTAYYDNVIPEVVCNSDVLYHEATFLVKDQELANMTLHSTSIDAANIAKHAKAKKLLLGHYSSRYENIHPLLDEAKTIFENTELAIEGKKIVL